MDRLNQIWESKQWKVIRTIVVIIIIMFLIYPIIAFFLPLTLLKILFYPALSMVQAITMVVLQITGLDIWICRGIAILFYYAIWYFIAGFIGNFITFEILLIKKERRKQLLALLVIVCIGMYFISKNLFFNVLTGEPLKNYYRYSDGRYEFFPIEMQFHPQMGDQLLPATTDVIKNYYKNINDSKYPTTIPPAIPPKVENGGPNKIRNKTGNTSPTDNKITKLESSKENSKDANNKLINDKSNESESIEKTRLSAFKSLLNSYKSTDVKIDPLTAGYLQDKKIALYVTPNSFDDGAKLYHVFQKYGMHVKYEIISEISSEDQSNIFYNANNDLLSAKAIQKTALSVRNMKISYGKSSSYFSIYLN